MTSDVLKIKQLLLSGCNESLQLGKQLLLTLWDDLHMYFPFKTKEAITDFNPLGENYFSEDSRILVHPDGDDLLTNTNLNPYTLSDWLDSFSGTIEIHGDTLCKHTCEEIFLKLVGDTCKVKNLICNLRESFTDFSGIKELIKNLNKVSLDEELLKIIERCENVEFKAWYDCCVFHPAIDYFYSITMEEADIIEKIFKLNPYLNLTFYLKPDMDENFKITINHTQNSSAESIYQIIGWYQIVYNERNAAQLKNMEWGRICKFIDNANN